MKKAVFLGFNALGDTLCTTPVLRAFREANPDTFVIYVVQNATFCRVLEGNPDVDLVLYNQLMYLHGLTKYSPEWVASLPLDLRETTNLYRLDIRFVCSKPESFTEHISVGFSKLLNIPIRSTRPIVVLSAGERRQARAFVDKPYVVLSMHSVSNPARKDGRGQVKDWPRENWLCLAKQIQGWGDFDVIAVGSENDPQFATPGVRNLYGLPIKVAAALLENAACVVTLENGLAHLAAAVDAPTVQIYSDVLALGWAYPAEATRWRTLYGDPLAISCDEVGAAVKSVLFERGAQP